MLWKSLVAMAALSVATPAMAGEWRAVGSNSETVVGIDMSRVETNGARLIAWEVQVTRSPDALGAVYYLLRVEHDCGRRTSAVIGTVGYNAAGGIAKAYREDRAAHEALPPDTFSESVWQVVCERGEVGDETYATVSAFVSVARAYLMR